MCMSGTQLVILCNFVKLAWFILFVFCRELVLVVVVVVAAVEAEVDLELPLHSEPVNNIIVNSMKNKHQ